MYKEEYLDFTWHHSFALKDFFVFDGNHKAFIFLEKYKSGHVLLNAPRFSGKSHLAQIFSSKYMQYDLDINNASDAFLIDIYNQQKNILWMLSSEVHKTFTLPDLKTRFNAMLKITIFEPNEDAFRKIIKKRFMDYGFEISELLLRYLSQRIDITYQSIENFVSSFHKYCLSNSILPSISSAANMLNEIS